MGDEFIFSQFLPLLARNNISSTQYPSLITHNQFQIDPDITKASTLPASFYKDEAVFEAIKEKVFLKSWQWIGDKDLVALDESVHPFVMLDNYLTEPMVLSRDSDSKVRCFTNVCTHRGNLVVQNPAKQRNMICMYHGRRFGLDGKFRKMPQFEEAEDFPRPCDDLHEFQLREWGQHLFVSPDPSFDFSSVIDKMKERVGFLPLNEFKLDTSHGKDYLINCHWALYCDNYLEGFHIPFVHSDLNDVLDYGDYTTEIYDHCNLQIGYSSGGEEVFDLPQGHPDFGRHVAAYYYWAFPNMMFNFYPWGLSINIVRPISMDKTKVSFISYVYDQSKLASGAGSILDKVEREDEFVVEGVHKGLKSRFYEAGRFSPTMEKGVHHFHSLLASHLNRPAEGRV